MAATPAPDIVIIRHLALFYPLLSVFMALLVVFNITNVVKLVVYLPSTASGIIYLV